MEEYPGGSLEGCEKGVRGSRLEREEEEVWLEESGSREERRKVRMSETCRTWRVMNQLDAFISLFSVTKVYNVAIKSNSPLIGCPDWKSGFYVTSLRLNFHIDKVLFKNCA